MSEKVWHDVPRIKIRTPVRWYSRSPSPLNRGDEDVKARHCDESGYRRGSDCDGLGDGLMEEGIACECSVRGFIEVGCIPMRRRVRCKVCDRPVILLWALESIVTGTTVVVDAGLICSNYF